MKRLAKSRKMRKFAEKFRYEKIGNYNICTHCSMHYYTCSSI